MIDGESAIAPLAPPASFRAAAEALRIAFEPGDLERLGLYLALLLDANRRFNLTRITDPEQAWRRHVLDALALLPLLADLPEGARLADVGSGGGAPGLPLAIAQPGLAVALIEATGKKARFLEATAQRLSLTNVKVFADRAETLAAARPPGPLRERFDVVTARALGRMPAALELTVPLAVEGGMILLIKGAQAQAEIAQAQAALRLLRARVLDVRDTPTGRIVVVEKIGATPREYPRKPGEPARKPLGGEGER